MAMKRPPLKAKRPAAERAVHRPLEKELARLASFPERNPNPVVEAGLNGRVLYLNPAARRLLPNLAQRGIGHPWLADWPSLVRALRRDPSKPIIRELALKARFYTQSIHYVQEVGRIRIYGMDITELKALEQRERERADSDIAAKAALDIIAAMPIGMASLCMSGRITLVNPAFESLTGYTQAEIAGQDARDAIGKIVAAGDQRQCLDLLQGAKRGKPAPSLAVTLRTKTGALVPAIVDQSFIKDPKGAPASMIVTFKNITDLRQAEERLRLNETRLSEAQRLAHFGNWNWNVLTGELAWSDEIYRIFGLQPQEFGATYEAFLKFVHPEDREKVQAAVNRALRNEQSYDIDHRVVLRNGAERVVHELGEVSRDKAGRPIRMMGTVQDVTDHKKAERRSQMFMTLLALFARKTTRAEYLDAVIKVIQQESGCRCIGIRIIDEKSRIPYAASIGFSPRFMESENDLVLGQDACICPRVLADAPASQDSASVTSGGSFHCDSLAALLAGLAADAKTHFRGVCLKSGYASIAVVPIRYADRMLGAIHMADEHIGRVSRAQIAFIETIMTPMIGEALRWFALDQSLRQAAAYNRSLIEASLDPLVTIDAEGKITDVNTGTEKITGYSRNKLIGTDFADYFTDFEKAQSGYQQVFREGWVQDYALEIRHRDGRVTPVLYNASVYRDEQGKVVGVFAAARDITERKQAEMAIAQYQHELRALASRLSLAEESARRQLAVALHDTVGQTQALAQIKLDVLGAQLPGGSARQAWSEIRSMFEKAVQQTRTLNFELSPPILYELGLDPALEWLGEEFQRRHGFQFHFDCAGDKSALDESLCVLLFQSARELLTNIVKHAGATRVYLASRIGDGQIVLSVRDNGRGFVAEGHMAAGKKNSLGLFSIRERMRYVGGRCEVASAPGQGATIELSAPVVFKKTHRARRRPDGLQHTRTQPPV